MPVFLVSRFALKYMPERQAMFHHSAGFIEATSVTEAEETALTKLLLDKSIKEGWEGHDIGVTETVREAMQDGADKARPYKEVFPTTVQDNTP